MNGHRGRLGTPIGSLIVIAVIVGLIVAIAWHISLHAAEPVPVQRLSFEGSVVLSEARTMYLVINNTGSADAQVRSITVFTNRDPVKIIPNVAGCDARGSIECTWQNLAAQPAMINALGLYIPSGGVVLIKLVSLDIPLLFDAGITYRANLITHNGSTCPFTVPADA